jgi:hypothetical protein
VLSEIIYVFPGRLGLPINSKHLILLDVIMFKYVFGRRNICHKSSPIIIFEMTAKILFLYNVIPQGIREPGRKFELAVIAMRKITYSMTSRTVKHN